MKILYVNQYLVSHFFLFPITIRNIYDIDFTIFVQFPDCFLLWNYSFFQFLFLQSSLSNLLMRKLEKVFNRIYNQLDARLMKLLSFSILKTVVLVRCHAESFPTPALDWKQHVFHLYCKDILHVWFRRLNIFDLRYLWKYTTSGVNILSSWLTWYKTPYLRCLNMKTI